MNRFFPTLFLLAATLAHAEDLPLELSGKRIKVPVDGAPATAVILVSTICPVSNSYLQRLEDLYRTWTPRGIRFVFINPNANETPAEVASHARANHLPFPVYTDPEETAVRLLAATMTPKAFVFDRRGELRYRGRIDDAVNLARVRSHDLRETLEGLLAGNLTPGLRESRALGCTIKRRRTDPAK